ncbi:hypothetical protein D7W81_01535 [Corallococcus aberystwythensis]|uniref:Uncharacterized protein n=2 Tax=Corallococcus aberystwythensis TaxID=2316722 RepID=A0A3A8R335_9BACT|nr:hypothetical protein D7W81_01535 [Corallococcus aberystwythensis]
MWAPPVQAEEEEARPPAATLVELLVEDGSLTARIQWSEHAEDVPSVATLVSYDGKGGFNAGGDLHPKPGEVSEVKLFGALKDPWETGWTQKLVLSDDQGQPLFTQPYDVNLDCPDDKGCDLTVAPGFGSPADDIHESEELSIALDQLREQYGEKEFNLLAAIEEDFPHLRGEALVYARQVVPRLEVKTGRRGCNCTWTSTNQYSPFYLMPSSHTYYANGGPHPGQPYARRFAVNDGPGSLHSVSASSRSKIDVFINKTAKGTSRLDAKLRCLTIGPGLDFDVPVRHLGQVTLVSFPSPTFMNCAPPCMARFIHMGRIHGQKVAMGGGATAQETASWRPNGQLFPVLSRSTSASAMINSFDDSLTYVGYSNYSNYNVVTATGKVTISTSAITAQASVTNGYAQAILGTFEGQGCPSTFSMPPYPVRDWGTTQASKRTSLIKGLETFFADNGVFVEVE